MSENKLTGSLGVRNEINVDIIGTGARGKEGKSAYEIWLDLGNEGTEQEYLASLKGQDGYTPVKGEDYFDGDKGEQGEKGEQGPKGDKGDTGEVTQEEFDELVTEVGKKANKEHEAWITPTLLNGWEERYPVGYRKNSIGQLEIKGRIRGGTLGLAVFNLPLGYRPEVIRTFLTMSNWNSAGCYVNINGDFIINSAYQKDTWVAIDLLIHI